MSPWSSSARSRGIPREPGLPQRRYRSSPDCSRGYRSPSASRCFVGGIPPSRLACVCRRYPRTAVRRLAPLRLVIPPALHLVAARFFRSISGGAFRAAWFDPNLLGFVARSRLCAGEDMWYVCYGLSREAIWRGLMNERSDDVGFGSREARARGEHGQKRRFEAQRKSKATTPGDASSPRIAREKTTTKRAREKKAATRRRAHSKMPSAA